MSVRGIDIIGPISGACQVQVHGGRASLSNVTGTTGYVLLQTLSRTTGIFVPYSKTEMARRFLEKAGEGDRAGFEEQ